MPTIIEVFENKNLIDIIQLDNIIVVAIGGHIHRSKVTVYRWCDGQTMLYCTNSYTMYILCIPHTSLTRVRGSPPDRQICYTYV